MAFLRFSRDKRGYEYFALVQPTNRRGKAGSRVLYAFRSPPNVRIGREPFDEAVRHALEVQNPDVTFDWPKLMATPMPAVEPERWRERRSAERAAKFAAQSEASTEPADVEREDAPVVSVPPPEPVVAEAAVSAAPASTENAESAPPSTRRRRRRRRGRRREGPVTQEAQGTQSVEGVREVQEVLESQEGDEILDGQEQEGREGQKVQEAPGGLDGLSVEPREPH